MSTRIHSHHSTLDTRSPVDTEMKRTEIDEVAEVKVTFNTRVRNRLEQLLGTDLLRLNDRQYMRTLMRRIYEDQEASLQRRAETRQMQENKRLKGLVEDMKMEKPPDMVETAFVVSFNKTKAEMEKVQRKQFNKRHNIKKRKTVSCSELDSEGETSPDVENITTSEQYHHSSFLGTTLDLSAEEDDSLAEERRQRELAQLAIKFGKYKEPLVQMLLQERTVPRLYDLAEIILTKPPKLQKKKKTAVVEEQEQASAEAGPGQTTSDSAEDNAGTEEEDEDEDEGEEDEEEEEEDEEEEEEEGEETEEDAGIRDTTKGSENGVTAAVDSSEAELHGSGQGGAPDDNSEATDGVVTDSSALEESEAALERDDAVDTEAEVADNGEEVALSEDYVTAEDAAVADTVEVGEEEPEED